jgi:transposase
MARVEVITGPERRRRWSDEQKRAIVAESLAPGAVISEVARRADVGAGQIYRWRKELGAVVNGFAPVLIAPPATLADGAVHGEPAIEVEFAGKSLPSGSDPRVRVRIPTSVSKELAAAVVKALSRR